MLTNQPNTNYTSICSLAPMLFPLAIACVKISVIHIKKSFLTVYYPTRVEITYTYKTINYTLLKLLYLINYMHN